MQLRRLLCVLSLLIVVSCNGDLPSSPQMDSSPRTSINSPQNTITVKISRTCVERDGRFTVTATILDGANEPVFPWRVDFTVYDEDGNVVVSVFRNTESDGTAEVTFIASGWSVGDYYVIADATGIGAPQVEFVIRDDCGAKKKKRRPKKSFFDWLWPFSSK